MSWLKKLMPARIRTEAPAGRKRSVPEGLWEKCDKCGAVLYRPETRRPYGVLEWPAMLRLLEAEQKNSGFPPYAQ